MCILKRFLSENIAQFLAILVFFKLFGTIFLARLFAHQLLRPSGNRALFLQPQMDFRQSLSGCYCCTTGQPGSNNAEEGSATTDRAECIKTKVSACADTPFGSQGHSQNRDLQLANGKQEMTAMPCLVPCKFNKLQQRPLIIF